jgi:hypothetical protein
MSSTKKPPRRLVTILEFLEAHPEYNESQLRWALRHREHNDLAGHVFKRPAYRAVTLVFSPSAMLTHLTRVVPA